VTDFSFEISEISPVERDIKVSAPEAMFAERSQALFDKLAASAPVKGFRAGKAPRHLVEKMYRARVLKDVQAELMEDGFREAIVRHDLRPVSRPQWKPREYAGQGDFIFSFVVQVLYDLKNVVIDGLTVERERVLVPDDVVDAELERRRQAAAVTKTVEGRSVVADKDWVRVSFEGKMDGEPVAGGKHDNELVEIGSNQFVPGFEEALIGRSAGEACSFTVTFPDDFRVEKLRRKDVVFDCTIHEICERVVPALDDEFAKDMGDYADLAQYRIAVREELEKFETERSKRSFRKRLWQKLVEANSFPLPPVLVDEETRDVAQRRLSEIARYGLNPETLGLKPEEFMAHAREEAENTLRAVLLREKLAEEYGVAVSDAEREAHIQKMAEEMNVELAKVTEYYSAKERLDELDHVLKHDKVSLILEEKVNVVEVDPKPAEPEHDHDHDHDHEHSHEHDSLDAATAPKLILDPNAPLDPPKPEGEKR